MNIKKTNKEITKELNKIENAINRKLLSFYNNNIKNSTLPTESIRAKYNQTVKNIIRQTVQESYLYGTKLVTKQISDINTDFIDFISVTDIQNIQSLTDKINNQFWKTADRLHRRENEFIISLADQELVKKTQFDTTAALIGFAAFASFLPFNNAVISKTNIVNQPIALGVGGSAFQNELLLLGEGEGIIPMQGKIMFLTQEDAAVDHEICEPLNRTVYEVGVDFDIPEPPLHNHCRCRMVPIIDEAQGI